MEYIILAEIRENYSNLYEGNKIYNDYVSRTSMLDLCNAINYLGYSCLFLGGIKELFDLYKSGKDISKTIFINYNYGLPAHFKRVQCPALLELMNARYSGSDPFVSLLVNDKAYTKKIVSGIGIKTPASILINCKMCIKEKIQNSNLTLPLVVKPNSEGSSIGITKECLCDTYSDAVNLCESKIYSFPEIIVEEYIPGYECTVWLIGNKDCFKLTAPLMISSSEKKYHKHNIFTMEDKASGSRIYSLPNSIIEKPLVDELSKISQDAFIELGLRDYARIDFRINNNGIYFIEANALPIFSQTSEIGEIVKLYNVPYIDICKSVIDTINSRLMTHAD